MAQQNLDFNIVAHTKGMEQIASLINRVGALEAEINKVKTANAGLAASSDAVIRGGVRYNNVMDAQSRSLRNARQGTQQLGMQINDFATSVSTGASVTQAFNQQIGQVGFALSMMGGRLGAVGTFLAGPWGAAITIATMVLGPFIAELLGVSDAADDARSALEELANQRANTEAQMTRLGRAQRELNDLTAREAELQREIRRISGGRTQGDGRTPMFAYRQYQELLDVQRRIREGQSAIFAETVQRRGEVLQRQRAAASADAASADRGAARAARELTEGLRAQTGQLEENLNLANQRARMRSERAGLQYLRYSRAELIAGLDEINQAAAQSSQNMQQAWIAANPVPVLQQPIRLIADEMRNAFEGVGQSVDDAFKGMISGAQGWRDALRGIIGSVIDQLWKLYVTQQIVGMVSSTLGSIGLPLPTGVPGRAIGGAVASNQPYMVGERGPELFIPGGNGTIIPNNNLSSGGGSVINVTVDARGAGDPAAVDARVRQGIMEAAPMIIAASQQRTIAAQSRPRLGGAIK